MPKREATEGCVQIRVLDDYKLVMNIVNVAILEEKLSYYLTLVM